MTEAIPTTPIVINIIANPNFFIATSIMRRLALTDASSVIQNLSLASIPI